VTLTQRRDADAPIKNVKREKKRRMQTRKKSLRGALREVGHMVRGAWHRELFSRKGVR
jgi:hypothetical protein